MTSALALVSAASVAGCAAIEDVPPVRYGIAVDAGQYKAASNAEEKVKQILSPSFL